MQRTCSRLSAVRRLAEQLVGGLRLELDLTPKPGLVDRWNNGSHSDLNYPLMAHSIDMLGGYFSDFAAGLEAGLTTEPLRRVAMEAEARMLAQFGTNTHRGAIFEDVPVDVANGWALPRLTTTRPRRGWQGWNGRQGSLRAPLSGPAGRL